MNIIQIIHLGGITVTKAIDRREMLSLALAEVVKECVQVRWCCLGILHLSLLTDLLGVLVLSYRIRYASSDLLVILVDKGPLSDSLTELNVVRGSVPTRSQFSHCIHLVVFDLSYLLGSAEDRMEASLLTLKDLDFEPGCEQQDRVQFVLCHTLLHHHRVLLLRWIDFIDSGRPLLHIWIFTL